MNKEEFKAKASQTIDEVSAKINELKAKKASVKEEAKAKFEESIKDLESNKTELGAKYAELENASEEKWNEAKNAFSSVSDTFEKELSKISSLYS
jgi:hypothetical protein